MKGTDFLKYQMLSQNFNGPENTSLIIGPIKTKRNDQNKSVVYAKHMKLLSPQNRLPKKDNNFSTNKVNFKTPMKPMGQQRLGRYDLNQTSGKVNQVLAKSLLNKSNVNRAIARDLSGPLKLENMKAVKKPNKFYLENPNHVLKNGSSIVEGNNKFTNEDYLKSVQQKHFEKDSLKNINPSQRDIVSEIDYSDAKSARSAILSKNRKNIRTPAMSQLTNDNLAKFEKELSSKSVIK